MNRIYRMKPESMHAMSRGFQVYLSDTEWQSFAQDMANDRGEPVRVLTEQGVKVATVHPKRAD